MAKPASGKLGYRPSIDGLRAVAVLLVIGYHAFPEALPGGFIGVDIFFVISGFLISTILYRGFAKPGSEGVRVIARFYGRRIRRIFPALAIVLGASLLLGYYLILPEDFATLCLDIAAAAGFCLNLVLAAQTGYFAQDAATRPLLHLWSLGVEEQFYLFWPLVIWAACRARLRILPVAAFIGGCSYFWMAYGMGTPPPAAFFLPQMRLWELLIGAAAAAMFPTGEPAEDGEEGGRQVAGRLSREFFSCAGAAMIIAGVIKISRATNPPNVLTLLPTLGTALVICAGEKTILSRALLSRRIPIWIGLISYPLYLWHWPLLTFVRLTCENGDSHAYVCAAIALATLLSWATYRLVEYPIRHGAKSAFKVVFPLAAVVSLGLLGFNTYRLRGYPGRFPPIIQDAFAAAKDHEKPWRVGEYFLGPDNSGDDFKVDKNEILPGKPTLVLWGDSHAASLYPGYAKYFARHYNIMQRTVAGIAPILEPKLPAKPDHWPINDYILSAIRKVRPDTVVLSANWLAYNWPQLGSTFTSLKSAGVQHIVVIGPLPQWKGAGLPQQLYNYYRTHSHDRLPKSMTYGIKEEPGRVDVKMREYCARQGVEYVSPCQLLFSNGGFVTRVGDTPDTLITFDYGHLTKVGAEYLVSKFPGSDGMPGAP